ncbi:3-mercaptopyruvate sulfurtransferase [Marinomonas aquimarina]|uniref:3-mercaptopyruvate sulfurtransferase n=1 Tax=Marinomonas aquimarina TaxID=295068 RepID=A0A1A8SZZ3_9GAMM|nr:sulfurtransferase [Marinomonas aquimarina]SBS25097.1 3-mercaptopyruvate sulfurtransferase [Marinomonas aquimarina]
MALPTLISVAQLHEMLEQKDLLILDSRFYLTDLEKGRQVYELGHIPGAVFVDLHHQLAGHETEQTGRHPLPEPEQLADTLMALGIDNNSQVVVYDDMGGAMAARAWWMLVQQGIEVYVLDGGFPAWQRAGYLIEAGENTPTPSTQRLNISYPWLVSEDDVVANFEAERFQLLDARAADRFQGENETMDPVAGHIPGAMNRPFMHNLNEQGMMKAPALLLDEWSGLLQDLEKPIVYYCGSGVTACHNVLAMNYAGLEAKHVYVGSWSQWAKRMLRKLDEANV